MVALVQFGLEWYRERRDREGYLKYLALEICIGLERYAVELVRTLTDEKEVQVSPGVYLTNVVQHVPKLHELPPREHYDKFDIALLSRVFELPDQISLANGQVNTIASMMDEKEAVKHATELACEIAVSAAGLAAEIRSAYDLNSRDLSHDAFDVLQILKIRKASNST